MIPTTVVVAFVRPTEPTATPIAKAGLVVAQVATGDPIPAGTTLAAGSTLGATSWIFQSFLDPVAAPGDGKHAGIFTDLFSAPGSPRFLVLESGEMPGLPNGERLKSMVGISLRDDGLLALVQLASGATAVGKVTPKNDLALVIFTGAQTAKLLLREGRPLDGVAGSTIKSFSVLQPALGSAGQGRWHGKGAVLAKDKTGLCCGDTNHPRLAARLGGKAPDKTGGDTEAVWSKFISYALPGSFGVTRSDNETASLAVLATFADKTQALVRIDLP